MIDTLLRLALCLVAFVYAWFVLPSSYAMAATLYLSPSTATVGVNGTVSVGVYVATNGETMNAASAKLSFPPSALSVSSISKSGSVINLWASEPSYSNSTGTISLEGVVLNPGYNGNSGKIATITFTARAEGAPNIQFTSGSVLKNDGMGTEMLNGKSGSTITIDGIAVSAPVPVSTATSPTVIKETSPSLQTPVITEYPVTVPEGETITVRGTTAKNATVRVEYQAENGDSRTDIVVADANGVFASLLINASSGSYRVSAETVGQNDTASTPSVSVVVLVPDDVMPAVSTAGGQTISSALAMASWFQTLPNWVRYSVIGFGLLVALLVAFWILVFVLRGIYQTIRRFHAVLRPRKEECIVRVAAPKIVHALSDLRKKIEMHKRIYGPAMDRATAIQEIDDLGKLVSDELAEMKGDLKEKK